MAVLNNSRDVLDRLKNNAGSDSLSPEESTRISLSINSEMEIVKREFNIKESESVNSAARIILTN